MTSGHDAARGDATPPDLVHLLEGRADARELRAVYNAVPVTHASLSPAEHEAAWQRLRTRVHDPARPPYAEDVRAPLELVREDVPVAPPAVTRLATPLTRRGWRAWAGWGAAAAVASALVGGVSWATGSTTYRVSAGAAPRAVTLAEGTSVWLAPGSELAVPRRIGWPSVVATSARTVQLAGEAFFVVQRDGRRFVVETPRARVEVLGTRFAVRSDVRVGTTRVDVSEGRVAVTAGSRRVELGAGDAVTAGARAWQRRRVNPAQVATWRTGGLAALDEPLGDVLAELGRRYGVRIEHDRAVDVTATVSLVYASAPTVDTVLADLCTAEGLVFERTSRGYRIMRP